MNRNWLIIGFFIAAMAAYQHFVLTPYQEKYVPKQTMTTPNVSTEDIASSGNANANQQKTSVFSSVSEDLKKTAKKIDVHSSRYFSLYANGGIGSAVFTKYFNRGEETKTNVKIIENGFHWRSSDVRVDKCLKNLSSNGELSYSAQVDGVSCGVKYKLNNLVLETAFDIQSDKEIRGDVFFETEDGIGKGTIQDHRYLALKKKESKTERIRDKSLWEANVRGSGPYDWISWGDKYFSANIIPKGRYNPDLYYQKGNEDTGRVLWGVAYPLKWTPENSKLSYNFDLYFSVKDLQELRSVRADFVETIDFGYFSGISRLMLWCLEMLFKFTSNYGISIIILSLVVRLLLWPINKKMFESGQKMKDIQPQMEAIKKKYEGKKEQLLQMNQEIQALYKKEGVNPFGSCLPVFLQIPIFFGLNSALSNAVDLYQAPFFGWIHDLSYHDPYYVLPVIWTISLIISVELNPQPTSTQPGMPDMKWISRIMFVVFGFVSKDFPSGLNLYFLVSNLAGMSQQFFFRKKTNIATNQSVLLGKES
jgi:YidC/Oxa1 family membrane protein insertase